MSHMELKFLAPIGIGFVIASCVAPGMALSKERIFSLDIPAQSLGPALRLFAHVTKEQIIFDENMVSGLSSNSVKGDYLPEDALSQILKDTHLSFRRDPSGVLIIFRAQGEGVTQSETETPESKPTEVAPAPEPATTEVVVTGKKNEVTDRIDRRVYDVKSDPQAQAGVIADVMNKLPSITVTPSGKVALRGDTNVVVMIDGKYPANGNAAVQSLPSSDVDHIEVMTNPSAQYAPDGTSGIINIITKKRHSLGVSGSVTANFSYPRQFVLSGNTIISKGPWTLDSRLNYSRGIYDSREIMSRDLPTQAQSDTRSRLDFETGLAVLNLGYKISDSTNVAVESEFYRAKLNTTSRQLYDDAVSSYSEDALEDKNLSYEGLNLLLDHTSPQNGANIKLNVNHINYDDDSAISFDHTASSGDDVGYDSWYRLTGPEDNVKIDYDRQFDSGDKLAAGAEFLDRTVDIDRSFDNLGAVEDTFDQTTSTFSGNRTISSLYFTYQTSLGKWTVLPGMRLESEDLNLTAPDLAERSKQTEFYPSFHVTRQLGDNAKFKASYSRRTLRPEMTQLDPSIVFSNSSTATQGNINLKPSQTDSFEAGYDYTAKNKSYAATIYYRVTEKTITTFSHETNDSIIITSNINSGTTKNAGVELTFRAPLSKHLKYSFNGNLFYNDVPLIYTDNASTRSQFTYSGNSMIEYDGDKGDQYQLNVSFTGKALTSQGYTTGFYRLDATWQHPLTARLSLVTSLFDILKSNDQKIVIDTPDLKARVSRPATDQSVRVALAYKFGGNR